MARYMFLAMYRAMHVYVTPEQHAYLQRASARTGWAMARFVRHALVHTYGPGLGHVDVELATEVGHGRVLADSFDRGFGGPVHSATGTESEAPMDAKRHRQSGLVDTLKSLVRVYLVVSRIRSSVKTAPRLRRTR